MHLIDRFVTTVTYVVSFFSFSEIDTYTNRQQTPLILDANINQPYAPPSGGPVFKPPTGRPVDLPGGDLVCNNTLMGPDWVSCSTADDRSCWLRNTKTGAKFDIETDYEDIKNLPIGTHRYYTLDLAAGNINADGIDFPHGKFFW
jgi:hypothetical protein